MKVLDTNIILRFMLNDHPVHAKLARKIFLGLKNGAGSALLKHYIIAEVIYVAEKRQNLSRLVIYEGIDLLLQYKGIICEDPEVVSDALKIFAKTSFDFADCLLAAEVLNHKYEIITLDKKLNKLANQPHA